MRAVLSIAISALSVWGCASPASHSAQVVGQPAEVRLQDARTDVRMGIVNDSHLTRLGVAGGSADERRVNFYSAVHGDSAPKVTSDEILAALIGYLDEAGFARLASAGPIVEGESPSISIEVSTGGATRHAARMKGMTAEDAKAFNELVMAFYQTYNAIPQYQAYDTDSAGDLFQTPEARQKGTGRN